MRDTSAIENQYSSGVYVKRSITLVQGNGALVWDEEGQRYIDCVGGLGAANLGHGNPAIATALADQAQRLIVCPELFCNDQRAVLTARLCQLSHLDRAFLCNSGAEAVEAAIKFARLATGRTQIVAAMRGFHGRTLGALSATWNPAYRAPFEPLLSGFHHVPYDKLEALERAVDEKTAAVLLEVVQGEGGVYPGSREYLRAAQELCRARGALFVLDEVQTGFGRTGRMFAFQHHDLQPDLLCLAKSIAGGVPMGATMIGSRVGELAPHLHGSTFGGNPLACAASLAAMDEMERLRLPQQAAENGEYFLSRLRDLRSSLIREVRGLGLMVGVELRKKCAPLLHALTEKGVLASLVRMNVIRFLPPLVVTREQLDAVVEALAAALRREEGVPL